MQSTTTYPTQPGQTVYVHQPAPVNYTTTVQNPDYSPGTSPRFNGSAGRATGILQLCLGIASIIVAIAQLVLSTAIGYVAFGIWGSILFYIPTGILGICSMNKNTCVIIGYLTMSIITANVAFGQLVTGAVGAGIISNYIYCDSYYYSYHWYCEPGAREGRIASDALLCIIGLVEMVVAIVASAYCCGGMSCGGGSSSTRTTTTVYTQQSTPMVVTTGQYGQPQQGMVQPPPAYNVQQTYPPPAQYNQQVVAPPAPAPAAYPPAPQGAVAQQAPQAHGKDNGGMLS